MNTYNLARTLPWLIVLQGSFHCIRRGVSRLSELHDDLTMQVHDASTEAVRRGRRNEREPRTTSAQLKDSRHTSQPTRNAQITNSESSPVRLRTATTCSARCRGCFAGARHAPRSAAHIMQSSRMRRLPGPPPGLGLRCRTEEARCFSSVAGLWESEDSLVEDADAALAAPFSSGDSDAARFTAMSKFTAAAGRAKRVHSNLSRSNGTGDAADTPVPSRKLTTFGGDMSEPSLEGSRELSSLSDAAVPGCGEHSVVWDNAVLECGNDATPAGGGVEDTNDARVGIGDMVEASAAHSASAAEKPPSDCGVVGEALPSIHHGGGDAKPGDDCPPADNRRLDAPAGPAGPTGPASFRGGVDGMTGEPLPSSSHHGAGEDGAGEWSAAPLEPPSGPKEEGPPPPEGPKDEEEEEPPPWSRPEAPQGPRGPGNLPLASSAASSEASSSSAVPFRQAGDG